MCCWHCKLKLIKLNWTNCWLWWQTQLRLELKIVQWNHMVETENTMLYFKMPCVVIFSIWKLEDWKFMKFDTICNKERCSNHISNSNYIGYYHSLNKMYSKITLFVQHAWLINYITQLLKALFSFLHLSCFVSCMRNSKNETCNKSRN